MVTLGNQSIFLVIEQNFYMVGGLECSWFSNHVKSVQFMLHLRFQCLSRMCRKFGLFAMMSIDSVGVCEEMYLCKFNDAGNLKHLHTK